MNRAFGMARLFYLGSLSGLKMAIHKYKHALHRGKLLDLILLNIKTLKERKSTSFVHLVEYSLLCETAQISCILQTQGIVKINSRNS